MPHLARALATLAFLALMLTGLGFVVAHLKGEAARTALAAVATRENVLDGRFTAVLDKQITAALPQLTGLEDVVSGLAYKVLGDAGDLVRAGCPGWLFYREELIETRGARANFETRLKIAAKIRDAFAARNLALVVLPVPDKALLAAEHLCGASVSGEARWRSEAWWAQSRALGLDQVEIAPGFPGAGRVAEALRRRIGPGTQKITLSESPPKARVGDLMRLAGLERTYSWSGPQPDEEPEVSAAIARTGGLLDDVPGPQVVLAGSSFSRNSGFLEYLQAASGYEVAQRSRDGSGFAGQLLELLMDEPQILAETRLVVWEFPMRALTRPLTDVERRFLGDAK